MIQTLTAKSVQAAKPPAEGRLEIGDRLVSGLTLRVTASGVRTWTVTYRVAGRLRRYTLGSADVLSLADAREAARKALAQAALGTDPAAARQEAREAEAARDAGTVGAMVERFMIEHVGQRKLRSADEIGRIFERYVLPRWRGRQARELRRADVKSLFAAVSTQHGPVQANRVVERLRTFFNFLLDEEVIEASPAARLVGHTETPRERTLSPDETVRLWRACEGLGRMGRLFRLLLLTGQRVGEVAGLAWGEIDAAGEWWTLPGARSMNKKAHRVYLAAPARAILAEFAAERVDGGPWVFPARLGDHPVTNYWRAFDAACAVARIDRATVTVHDLRRTAASLLGELGVSRFIIGKCLNHTTERAITGIYDLYQYAAEKRAAWERLAAHLLALVEGRPAKVIPLRAGAGASVPA
jgi:integrase